MSAHSVSVVIRGKDLKKYESQLTDILNKGFVYNWFYGSDVYVTDEEITITEETKNCEFKKLINAITKGMPEVEEVHYALAPYWKYQDIYPDYCDDEFGYWTKNKEWRKAVFGDARMKWSLYNAAQWFIEKEFDKARERCADELEPDEECDNDNWMVISEAYNSVCTAISDAFSNHTYPFGFNMVKV